MTFQPLKLFVCFCFWGCTASAGREPDVPSTTNQQTVNKHNVLVGDSVPQTSLTCFPGGRHGFPSQGFELITFSSLGDCSACLPHLKGLEQIIASGAVGRSAYFIVWAPRSQWQSNVTAYHQWSQRPVCFDDADRTWDAMRIAHTPVTVVVGASRVMYMNDLPLEEPRAQAQFINDLRRLMGRSVMP